MPRSPAWVPSPPTRRASSDSRSRSSPASTRRTGWCRRSPKQPRESEVSQPRPSRRPAPVEPDELEAPPPRGRQAWLALLVMAVLIAAVAGGGLLIKHAIEPVVPAALANCPTSTQIAPHEYIGPQPMCITAAQKLEATITTSQGDNVVQLHHEVAPVTLQHCLVIAVPAS